MQYYIFCAAQLIDDCWIWMSTRRFQAEVWTDGKNFIVSLKIYVAFNGFITPSAPFLQPR